MIRLGLRLAVSGGREAAVRLVVLAAAVGIGVGLLLTAVSAVNAVGAQNDRYAWLDTRDQQPSADGLRQEARWPGSTIVGADSPPTTSTERPSSGSTWRPPGRRRRCRGLPRDPGPGQYYASPALSALLASTPRDELADRYPGRQIGVIGNAALAAPNSLIIVIGRTPRRWPSLRVRRGGDQHQHHPVQQLQRR